MLVNLNVSKSKVKVLIIENYPIINVHALPIKNTSYTISQASEQNAFT